MLEFMNVSKYYQSKNQSTATWALRDIDLRLEDGSFTALMGPSGAGKSTLLNLAATIDSPSSGSIKVKGRRIDNLKGRDLSRFRRESLGFIFQDANLLETLTLGENILLPLTFSGRQVPPSERKARVAEIAKVLDIADLLDRYPAEVSGGQAQRAAVARALCPQPHLLLADEPTGALDSKNARDLLERFILLQRRFNTTILLVTHDPLVASYCRRVVYIKDGRLFSETSRSESSDDNERRARGEFYERILKTLSALETGAAS